jgi:hypothetical protein
MEEFLNYLLDLCASDELAAEEIDRALTDRDFAYQVFMDCWKCDRSGTGEMAQQVFLKVKEYLARRKHGKSDT